MQFHETVYGHRFFDGQLPSLIKNLGRIADALEAKDSINASQEESTFKYNISHVASKEDINNAEEGIFEANFEKAREFDPDFSEEQLLANYKRASLIEKAAMDQLLINLCGYSMKSLLKEDEVIS